MIKKTIIFLLMTFALGGCMEENSLIEEVKSLPKPGNFERVSIDDIAEKYFKKGVSREEISSQLEELGFSVFTQTKDESHIKFENSEGLILIGAYDIKKNALLPADYRITIYFGFEAETFSNMKAFYAKHMY